jgi:mannose-6-phosphate isomerase
LNELYPLKFKPIIKDKIWGGTRLNQVLNKTHASAKAGESWEISGLPGNISVVANGFLKGNDLLELIEIYMGDLVGDHIFEQFGNDFPLLIKFIDANDILSLQVHPDDDAAFSSHGSWGKTEMWYIIHADKDAEIISGFKEQMDRKTFINILHNNRLDDVLNTVSAEEGDVFFIPSGRVHAISAGILLAEIQQSSDITYRIFDWNRQDENGKNRELHLDLALDSIDFSITNEAKIKYQITVNKTVPVVDCPYFKTNLIHLDAAVNKDFALNDSFVIYICTEGQVDVGYGRKKKIILSKGETVLIPASLKEITIHPAEKSTLLEVYTE